MVFASNFLSIMKSILVVADVSYVVGLLWEMTSGRSFPYQIRVSSRVVGLFLTSFSFSKKKAILSLILTDVFFFSSSVEHDLRKVFFFPFYGHGHVDDWAWDIVYVHVYSEIRNNVTKRNRSRGMDAVPDRDVMIFGHNLWLEILELKMWVVIRALICDNSQDHWGMMERPFSWRTRAAMQSGLWQWNFYLIQRIFRLLEIWTKDKKRRTCPRKNNSISVSKLRFAVKEERRRGVIESVWSQLEDNGVIQAVRYIAEPSRWVRR